MMARIITAFALGLVDKKLKGRLALQAPLYALAPAHRPRVLDSPIVQRIQTLTCWQQLWQR